MLLNFTVDENCVLKEIFRSNISQKVLCTSNEGIGKSIKSNVLRFFTYLLKQHLDFRIYIMSHRNQLILDSVTLFFCQRVWASRYMISHVRVERMCPLSPSKSLLKAMNYCTLVSCTKPVLAETNIETLNRNIIPIRHIVCRYWEELISVGLIKDYNVTALF